VNEQTEEWSSDRRSSIPYRIVSQLAVDASGLLYRAIREDDGSEVDVLVLGNLEASMRDSVRRRIALARQLNHPAIARVYDSDLDDSKQSYVLQRIPDQCLSDIGSVAIHQDKHRLLSYGCQIASAVAAGHRMGLVHGSLSPDTVRVCDDGSLQIDFVRPWTGRGSHSPSHDTGHQPVPLEELDPADDAFDLASLLVWLYAGPEGQPAGKIAEFRQHVIDGIPAAANHPAELDAFCDAVQDAFAEDPADRAAVQEICDRLERLAASVGEIGIDFEVTGVITKAPPQLAATGEFDYSVDSGGSRASSVSAAGRIGRFQIVRKLGEGGMGEVYEAVDPADGTTVAIKVVKREALSRRGALRRFQKEARLLGEIKSPYVTNLLEVNQDRGLHYIVLEFVSGFDLREMIDRGAPFEEHVALSLIADTARGLASAHNREIIHRDIKPGNILLAYDQEAASAENVHELSIAESLRHIRVKLTDFGLARHIDQSESMQMTKEGGSVGTPLYMSPEQFSSSAEISPATDVYAMGITLYEMLAGKPPFTGTDLTQLINKHCRESPRPLQSINSDVSDAACEIIQRAIAKRPEDRYSDAGQMLRDIERLLRGEPSDIESQPRLPDHNAGDVFEEVFQWQLKSDAAQLWPYISNTERINAAVGVPSVVYQTRRDEQGRLRKFGNFKMAGLQIGWEEHPFEWVEGQRLGILREFDQGPFVWFLSIVELTPQLDGGTLLTHTVRILPRGLMGRLVATLEVTVKGKLNLNRVYNRIDQSIMGALGSSSLVDPFSDAQKLSVTRRRRLDQGLDRLADRGVDPDVIECLGNFLRDAPSQELGRIRPIALARNFGINADRVTEGCLAAAREGLLDLHWDILCPTCRISSQVSNTLQEIEDHARCEVCDLDFDVDLARSVEMIFRAQPEIRQADLGTYCIGGPEHSPHVVLQIRLAPGKRVELTPLLSEGEYVLRSSQMAYTYRLRALPGKGTTHTEIVLAPGLELNPTANVRAGRNVLMLTNDYDHEIVIRLERTIPRKDVITAAQASSLPLFRELFPHESPKLGQLIHVETITLLAADILDADRLYRDHGDAEAYAQVQRFHTILKQVSRKHSGALVKVLNAAALFAFESPPFVIDAMLELAAELDHAEGLDLQFRAAVHRGTALATSTDKHLDYFGGTVHLVGKMVQLAGAAELLMTETVASDPMVSGVIQKRGLHADVCDLTQLGRQGERCQRVQLAASPAAATRIADSRT
jgi:serine/threonine protein kinase/class 3 adenylate cyclase